jgi:hypothetical protein
MLERTIMPLFPLLRSRAAVLLLALPLSTVAVACGNDSSTQTTPGATTKSTEAMTDSSMKDGDKMTDGSMKDGEKKTGTTEAMTDKSSTTKAGS